MGNAKRDFAGSPLVERHRGGDPKQIGEAQDASRLRAGVIDDPYFVCGVSGHRFVAPGQIFDPFGN
jgi:hypothetical protein